MEKKKELRYLTFMKDNDISLSDLPKEIKLKINALKPTIARFNQSNPPSEKLEEAIIKQDVIIAEMIADYIEKDLPDAPEKVEEEVVEEVKEEVKESIVESVEKPIENVDPIPVVIEEVIEEVIAPVIVAPVVETRVRKYDEGTLEQEKEILLECQKNNGFIDEANLLRILNKGKWDISISNEYVYSIVVRKVYSKPLYKLVS